MRHVARVGQLGVSVLGLGIGTVLAVTPGAALANASTEPFSLVDHPLFALSDPASTGLDVQISISGIDLLPTVGNTAIAESSIGNIAIAIGDGADANAVGSIPFLGIFNTALAVGTDSSATATLFGALNIASAIGTGSTAGTGVGAILSLSSAIGDGSNAGAGIVGAFDLASAIGKDTTASGFFGVGNVASALGADSTVGAGVGIANIATAIAGAEASVVGILGTAFAAGAGSDALAGVLLNAAVAIGDHVAATASGIFDLAIAEGMNAVVKAMDGLFDLAFGLGTGSDPIDVYAGGTSSGLLGSADIASVIGSGSTATAGSDATTPGNFDLASALGDLLHADATGGSFLIDIAPFLSSPI